MRKDMKFVPVTVVATNHVDAWMQLMRNALDYGTEYTISAGSHAGSFRLSLDCAHVYIRYPETRPLYPLAKEGLIPPVGKVMLGDTEVDEIEFYFHHYVYNPHGPKEHEHYNYSQWLTPLADAIIDYYALKGFETAHATMRVGDPFCFKSYFEHYRDETSRPTTPCLLAIDTRIMPGSNAGEYFLVFYVYYRSWDLFGGFLTNMGGFQLLKEFMADMISMKANKTVLPGPSIAVCKDLHLYEHHVKAARDWLAI